MPGSKQLEQELIQLYNEIDQFMRRQYKQDRYADHSFLLEQLARNNHIIAKNQQLLRAVAQLRNSLVHNPIPSLADPIVTPNENLVKSYRDIRNALLNPHTALSIAIPRQKIYTSTKQAKLMDVVQTMEDNTFTHVPILEGDKMIGVFSENTLLSYLVDSKETIITKDMLIGDLAKYLPLSAHRGEIFVFLPRSAKLSEVYEIFNKYIKVHQRVGMLIITENGLETEKPLGIITAWDLASPDFQL